MQILNLLRQESTSVLRDILIAASLAGLSSSATLAIINSASQTAAYDNLNFRYLVMFLLTVSLYVICLRYTFDRTTQIFESIIERIRTRISDKIRRADLKVLDNIGKAEIYNRLTQETTTISQFSNLLSAAMQSAMIAIFVALYLVLLSGHAFIITASLMTGGILIYLRADKECKRYIEHTSQKEIKFFEIFTHIIDGFQEIRVNQRRSDDIFKYAKVLSRTVKNFKIKADRLYNQTYILAQLIVYFNLAAIVFVLPRLVPTYTAVITETTTAIMFILGPLGTVVAAIPNLSKANIAVAHIFDLERRLDAYQRSAESSRYSEIKTIDAFEKISLIDIEFTYEDKSENRLFTIGPLSLTVYAGETLFIIGGNGSGKSTLLKLLAGLYYPERGTILIDDLRIDSSTAQSYRELFSIIFSDFHLFDKLYGLRDVRQDTVQELLKLMGLSNKTAFVDGRFTTLDLSTGQRKRLALLVTLLEDRPIYVFDEWAAEQDPEFRAYFYDVLLQELHERGKTIISVTHDDRYFHRADRIVKMDYGKIEFIKTPSEL
jgi:putative pyoverdin transport system ATP-binding/permease protein